jgi:hypothetical protein
LLDRILARYFLQYLFIASREVAVFWLIFTKQPNLNCLRGGRYTEEDAKAIIVQILSVVAFCHLQGVVHRDLKPEVSWNYFVYSLYICAEGEPWRNGKAVALWSWVQVLKTAYCRNAGNRVNKFGKFYRNSPKFD